MELSGNHTTWGYVMGNVNNSNWSSTISPEMQALVDYYHGWSKGLRLYVTPCIIFGGTVGNLLTIAVVLSHHFRHSPSSIPLIALAFVDVGVLYFTLLDVWLSAMLGDDSLQYTRHLSPWGCKFSTFITVFLTHLSSWILVLINVDRVICVFKPLKARTWCTKRRLGIALTIIILVLMLVSVHLFWTTKYYAEWDSERCQYDQAMLGTHGELVWTAVDASLFTFIPFIIIFVCNVSIICSLIHARRKRKESYQGRTSLPSDSTTSITTMLMTISIVFLITTSPLTVCYQFYDQIMQQFQDDPVGRALWYDLVINTVLLLVCYSNNAVNFLLYCISGSKFRLALADVCAGRIGKRYRRRSTFQAYTLRMSTDNYGHNGLLTGYPVGDRNARGASKSRSPSCVSMEPIKRPGMWQGNYMHKFKK